MPICLIQYFEADFLWEVSLKILNSGIQILKHAVCLRNIYNFKFILSIAFIQMDCKSEKLCLSA